MAEQMCIYMSFHVKKLTQVLVRVFMQRLEQMNGYLRDVGSYRTYLAWRIVMLLRPKPKEWIGLSAKTNLAWLCYARALAHGRDSTASYANLFPLNCVPCAIICSKKRKSEAEKDEDMGCAKHKVKCTRPKSGDGKAYHIPKMAQHEKFCQRCKEHGGAHKTHNTLDCWKYNKDGSFQSSFSVNRKVPGVGTMGKTNAKALHSSKLRWPTSRLR